MSIKVNFVLLFDFIALFFLGLVRLISSSVLFFSTSYIREEKFFARFLIILVLFVGSIWLLILRPNLISLLLGWDGLGVTSYLLVIFYQRRKSYNAGMITALTNRLGDVGLLVCISLLIVQGDWTFLFPTLQREILSYGLVLILILSACTKRAQMPFSSWLPAAMAAPTPVSALVHSSTLVTAGVYLLIRFNYLFTRRECVKILFFIGRITMLMAGLAAINEIDIKKVIALSTLSQLGVIIITLGLGSPHLSFFHLLSHAYFKAMLFICAGSLIHSIKEYQDIRTISLSERGRVKVMSILIIANFSLCGLPFISGFYSKDLILELLLLNNISWSFLLVGFLGTALTVAYSCRISYLLIGRFATGEKVDFMEDRQFFILGGIFFLLPFSVVGGYFISCQIMSVSVPIYLPLWIKIYIPSALILGYLLRLTGLEKERIIKKAYNHFLGTMWFMPLLYRASLRQGGINYSKDILIRCETSWLVFIVNIGGFNIFSRSGTSVARLNDLNALRIFLLIRLFLFVKRI